MSTAAGTPATIQVDHLTRRFGEHVAVDDISFLVPAGLMTGFVGGNGAGKTTTMRMIMGVLGIHAGQVSWGDRPITTADRRSIGYMPEERGLYPKQKVAQQLVYLAQLKGMDAGSAKRVVEEHLERLGLADRAGDNLEALSLGNQQRVQIIAALMIRPAALILDEPFSGLDPAAVDAMADLLREHTARGVPVLFSSHQLDLVDRLCDRLIILSGGTVRAQGTPDELRGSAPRRHRLGVVGDAGWVRGTPGLHVLDVDGPQAVVELSEDDPAEQQRTLDALLSEGVRRGGVTELTPIIPPLSDIYREATA
ncbi:ATP-binding cassette domain-containing protein [Janibacter alkaliphilus]|uniref:ABC-2 type transport system ATP-binding protein n=1 Tax=Janibacter alkaliphilus TaxID=1069963 RepID=A0A852WZZ9_9MICO|nr:ATP-binding cassette domain-containing protein [Janibacter alkaliphilus]NYG36189.1 ABC-2 type transport system ATP-binding protein [Janibacter alkaliphilus]